LTLPAAGTRWMMAAVRPEGQRVVVVGAGTVGRRRAELFARHGADVRIFDPKGDAETQWPSGVRFYRKRVSRRDLLNAWMVVLACSDPETIVQVDAWAQELGLEVNRADDVDQGTFAVPALLEDPAGWQLAVLGGEAGPLFSTWLRGLLEHVTMLPQVNHVYQALAAARAALKGHPRLTQLQRAEIMRQVMAHALASAESIDGAALAAELAAQQLG